MANDAHEALNALEHSFVTAGLPADLVHHVLTEYAEVKRRYFLGDLKPGSLHGGRFCEAVVRVLEYRATGSYTPHADKIDVEKTLNRLDQYGPQLGDALRLHTVRAIRLVYGIRNSRDNGHLKDGIDAHLQDSSLVVACLDWILAELVRIWHGVSAVAAGELIRGIVTKQVPIVEVLGERPVLSRTVSPMDHVLVILYWANREPIRRRELGGMLPGKINVTRELGKAETLHLVHVNGDEIYLRAAGKKYIEDGDLLRPQPA